MNTFINFGKGWVAFVLFTVANLLWSQQTDNNRGAFILISKQGDVRYLNAENQEMPKVVVGSIIPSTYLVVTGEGGSLVGLLSNGTLLTLDQNTQMKVASFKQKPFKDDGRKLTDLAGEPSSSEVLIDLDFGSLVVKTKKLKKESSFNIDSPVGVAGIRGTEFQMASNPGQGVQLDVTESTVAFTPPGGGEIAVSQGSGLSVSPSGVATQRPVNPVVATKIVATNTAAVEATQDVSMGEVVAAVEQTLMSPEESSMESTDSEFKKSESENEEAIEPEDPEVELEKEEERESENNNLEKSSPSEKTEQPDSKQQQPQKDKSGSNSIRESKRTEKGRSNQQAVQPDKSMLLENNPELKKNQSLAKFGLSRLQKERYDRLSSSAREEILQEKPGVVSRLLGLPGFEKMQADLFFSHDRETRDLLLLMSDEVIVTLLDPTVDKALLKESLQKIVRGTTPPGSLPSVSPSTAINNRAVELGDRLMERGDSDLMDELLEMSNGSLNEEWLKVGEVAEVLTRRLEVGDFSGVDTVLADDFWGNPFFLEVANVYDQLELDALVNGAEKVMGGDHLIVLENANAFGSHFSNGVSEVLLVSRDLIEFNGDFTWSTPENEGARLVVMSGGELKLSDGATIRSVTSDLVLASRENLLLNQVILEGANEVAIRGMRDVELNDVTMRARMLATVKARRDLNVNGLNFNQDISRIVMEAQTMRLRNVNFPGMAQVRLNSLKGAIDGRYPNFGNVSAAQQIGRVNFIENVRSGGNLLFDRPSFDLHGKNIEIGKIARP
jgi:hypothetical protein